MNKLTVVFSGRKSSGKSSHGKFIAAEYLNKRIKKIRFIVEKVGKHVLFIDTFNNNKVLDIDKPGPHTKEIADVYSMKIYSFADPLKEFCINVFGLDTAQCYGTESEKNSLTHINWDNFTDDIKEKYSRPRRGTGGIKPASGYMTAREVMQVFGTDVCRQIDLNCWARGLYSKIERDNYELAICVDARFPNEITMGTEKGCKAIRLSRNPYNDTHVSEMALDNFPLGEYSLVIDNTNMTVKDCQRFLKPHIHDWFEQYKL